MTFSLAPATEQPLFKRRQASPRTDSSSGPSPLWLCLYLPKLALEALALNLEDRPFRAVLDKNGPRTVIHTASRAAESCGITPGMTLATAHALCPALQVHRRDLPAEHLSLERLAIWATQFTSMLSLEPPRALLLEIGGSLRLFGGLSILNQRIGNGISARNHQWTGAVAPTPLASLLLAANGEHSVVIRKQELRSVLGKLSITVLPLKDRQRWRLSKAGIQTLHDLWRLPRDGLARRFGHQLLQILDRAQGLTPEPHKPFHIPDHFQISRELPAELSDTGMLLEASRPLIERLTDYLRHRDAGTTRLRLTLCHSRGRSSRIEIGMRHCTRNVNLLLELLKEHLNRRRLSASIIEIRLSTMHIHPFTPISQDLFAHHGPAHAGSEHGELQWQQLLEQLQTRLGSKTLHNIHLAADHRPERAWTRGAPANTPLLAANRPLWLLPKPQSLILRNDHPWQNGPLSLLSDPERIEGGWWDGQDIRRDYYTAVTSNGSRLWIFRDLRKANAWYLHGYFG